MKDTKREYVAAIIGVIIVIAGIVAEDKVMAGCGLFLIIYSLL